MKLLYLTVLRSVLDCFDEVPDAHPVPEHIAIHRSRRDVAHEAHTLSRVGFKIVSETLTATFVENKTTGIRLKIIEPDVEQHVAWAVRARIKFFELEDAFRNNHQFAACGNRIRNTDFLAVRFRHVQSGAVIQLVWRKKQLFKGIFEGTLRVKENEFFHV